MINKNTQSSSHNTNSKYKELDLSLSEDLVVFSDSVHEAYEEAISCKPYAESEQYKSLSVEDIAGEDIFETLAEKFTILVEKVSRCKEMQGKNIEIPDELVVEMQTFYNDIILLKNYILETYENLIFDEKEKTLNIEIGPKKVINDFEQKPNTKVIIERADEIIDRLSSAKETPHHILNKASDLYEEIKDAELNLPQDLNKLQEAYKKLEDFAKDIPEILSSTSSVDVPSSHEDETSQAEDDNEPNTTPIFRRKTMEIISDNEEGDILITVANKAEEIIDNNTMEARHNVVQDNLNDSEESALANIETIDPINSVVSNLSNVKERNWQQPQRQSLASEFILNKNQLNVIKDRYGSIESFDRILNVSIVKIDKTTEDTFERWLGEKRTSPFLYLKNKRLSEIEKLANSSSIREILAVKNIKYEAFLAWVDLMYEMLDSVGDIGDIKFGELFVLFIMESDFQK